jgi:hypothetical protein
MKHLKILAVAAIAASALMAFAGTASATTLTSGGKTVSQGTVLHSVLKAGTAAILKSSLIGEVKCTESTVSGATENEGSATETVKGAISTLDFSSCNATVEVLKAGSLEVHTEYTKEENGEEKQKTTADGNGTLTSNGAEVTVEILGLHCIFTTSNTDIGTATGTTEGSATFEAKSAPISRTGGRSGAFCGSSALWNATYIVDEVGGVKGANLLID